MREFINRLICKIRGHKFGASSFNNFSFCQRCGKEIADRTFDDIEPVEDDHNWLNDPDYMEDE